MKTRCAARTSPQSIMETDPRRPTVSRCRCPGYLTEVKKLTERYDALYIADEVQTGMMTHRRDVGLSALRASNPTSW
jgi:hypothetical protein